MDFQIPPTALVAASVPLEQGGATEHSEPPNLADPNPTPELVMLSYDDRHYRFCHVCRKWWYWGRGECHNSDCKRYVAPEDRLRGSPQFFALEATQPPWDRIALHDSVFSLEDRGGSCRAKKDVVVLTGVTKTNLHERHDPPLKGKRIELAVRAKGDAPASRGADSVDVVANCHNWISGQLAGSGGIKAKHDGRNFHLLDAVPTRYTEEFVRTFVDLIVAALQTDQKSCRCTLSCKKGRHRSVASAYWFAVMLTILGAEVIVHIPSARLCPCKTCDACTYILLAKHWDTWCIDIQESAIEYIKSHCSDMTIVRDGLIKTIEFLEFCEIGL